MLLLMTPLQYERFTRLFNPILLQTPEIYEKGRMNGLPRCVPQKVPWVVLKGWTVHSGLIMAKGKSFKTKQITTPTYTFKCLLIKRLSNIWVTPYAELGNNRTTSPCQVFTPMCFNFTLLTGYQDWLQNTTIFILWEMSLKETCYVNSENTIKCGSSLKVPLISSLIFFSVLCSLMPGSFFAFSLLLGFPFQP